MNSFHKYLFSFIIFLQPGLIIHCSAQDGNSIQVNSKITKVTVFLQGAQVTRETEVSLEKGITYLVFDNVPATIEEKSIQLSGANQVNLLSVVHKVNYLDEASYSPKIKSLQDSIDKVDFLLEEIANYRFVLNQELELITSNKNMKGEKGIDMAAFEEMQELYRKRLPLIKDDLLKNSLEERRLNTKKLRLQNELNEIKGSLSNGRHSILVALKSEQPRKVKLELSYFTSSASWYPTYDVRCVGLDQPIQLVYKANIRQSSGEDWNKVNLRISTGNPNLSGTRPELMPQYLSLDDYKTYQNYSVDGNNVPAISGNALRKREAPSVSSGRPNNIPGANNEMDQKLLNTEFVIAVPYSIPATGKEITVEARTFELPARYLLTSVPRIDKSIFLLAQVSATDEIAQLNGMASVYLEGMYVGQSAVINSSDDSLQISLGRDKTIIVERKKLREKSKSSFIGNKKNQEIVYEITVRNTRNSAIGIVVEDQVPVSTTSDIEVVINDKGGADTHDEMSGKLTWNLTLQPGETKKLTISYTIRYPKNKRITGL